MPPSLALTLRVFGVFTVLGITVLVVLSTLIGTEQEWGLHNRPLPILLLPLAEAAFGLVFALGVWKLRGVGLVSIVACFVAALGLLLWLSRAGRG